LSQDKTAFLTSVLLGGAVIFCNRDVRNVLLANESLFSFK
jgi:hypothetical protein